jgi:predicted TIM-barrel fold metal-dependent hydrolase
VTEKRLIIDLHTHYHPEGTKHLARKADGTNYPAMVQSGGNVLTMIHDLEKRFQMMDDAGMDMIVPNQAPWSPQGMDMCRAINDGYAEAGREYPDRIIPCAHLPLEGNQKVLDELDRAITELGLKGLALVTSSTHKTLDSEDLFPIYEKVSVYDIPIVIHPTIRPGLWGGSKYGMGDVIERQD